VRPDEEEVVEERLTLILIFLGDGAGLMVEGAGLLLKWVGLLPEGTASTDLSWSLFIGGIKSLFSESSDLVLRESNTVPPIKTL